MNRTQTLGRRKQAGNALVYSLLGLVIGGIGLAVAVTQFGDGERATSVQATIGEVNAIIGNVKENYGQYNYAGLSTAVAVSGRVIPDTLHTSTTAANNKYGGAINLVDNNAAVAGTALLSYASIPREICAKLINGTQGMASRVQVGGVDVKALNGQVNVTAMNAQCSASSTVTVNWTVGRT